MPSLAPVLSLVKYLNSSRSWPGSQGRITRAFGLASGCLASKRSLRWAAASIPSRDQVQMRTEQPILGAIGALQLAGSLERQPRSATDVACDVGWLPDQMFDPVLQCVTGDRGKGQGDELRALPLEQ